jgi:hypothetical protein
LRWGHRLELLAQDGPGADQDAQKAPLDRLGSVCIT